MQIPGHANAAPGMQIWPNMCAPIFPSSTGPPFSGRRSSVFAYLGYFLSLYRRWAIVPRIRAINPNIACESNCWHDWQIASSVPRSESAGDGTPSSGFFNARMLPLLYAERRLELSTRWGWWYATGGLRVGFFAGTSGCPVASVIREKLLRHTRLDN